MEATQTIYHPGLRSSKGEEGEGEGKLRLLLSILRRCNCGIWFGSNTTINPWGRGDINNLRAWARMRMRARKRKYLSPHHPSILQHHNRSEVETAAARGPVRTVYKYDIVIDTIATEEDSHNQCARRRGPGCRGVGHESGCLVRRGASKRRRGTVIQQPTRRGAGTLCMNDLLIRFGAWGGCFC